MTITRQYALEHFDEFCDRAERGEEIVLKRPGHPGLTLAPKPQEQGGSSPEAVEAMREFMRAQPRIEGRINYRKLIEEGRRY